MNLIEQLKSLEQNAASTDSTLTHVSHAFASLNLLPSIISALEAGEGLKVALETAESFYSDRNCPVSHDQLQEAFKALEAYNKALV